MLHTALFSRFLLCTFCLASRSIAKEHFAASKYGRRAISDPTDPLQIDLDYSIYEGYYDSSLQLNIWKGYIGTDLLIVE